MKKLTYLISSLAVLSLAAPLGAATYHVAVSGNDANPGSSTQPWKTIQKAVDTSAPGDTILVGAGYYPENVRVRTTGTSASKRLTLKGNGAPRVNGFFVTVPGITIDGFEVAHDSVTQYDGAIRVNPTAHALWVLNNNIHNLTNRYGVLFVSGGVRPENSSQSCIISNNIFNYIGYINVNLYGKDHLVVSNTFANSFGEGDGVRVWGSGHLVAGNTFTNLGGGGNIGGGHPDVVQSFGDYGVAAFDFTFERNVIINCLSQICQIEQKGVADIRDWTFRNNLFVNVAYAANCNLPGVWWLNNTFYRCTTNTGHVIVFSDGSSGRGAATRSGAKNNVFLECGSNPDNNTFGWYIAPAVLLDLDCDYNYVAGPGFAPKRTDLVRSVFRFVEAHGVNGGDPGFSSIESKNFALRSTSLLRDRGVNLSAFSYDLYGLSRVGTFDIGAIEFRPPEPASDLRIVQ